MGLSLRANLIEATPYQGLLDEFENGGELSDAVFDAAATIEVKKDDLGECVLLSELRAKPPEEIAKVKAEWLAEGYDPERPPSSARFLEAVRAAMKQRR